MIPYRLNPLGITLSETIPLTLTAEQANSTVTLNATGSPTVSGLHYRLGKSGIWLPYTIGDTVTLANVGDSVQFWNNLDTLGTSDANYLHFVLSGIINASGNIQSLLNWSLSCPSFCFVKLFLGQNALISGPEMPALTLNTGCYQSMYENCEEMITTCKVIPADTLKTQSMLSAYRNCRKLTAAPQILATSYFASCMYAAFYNCQSLTAAPVLHGTSIADYSFHYAFYGCTNLSRVEVNFTAWHTIGTTNWLSETSASGIFIKPTALPEEYGPNRIPTGWTVVNK